MSIALRVECGRSKNYVLLTSACCTAAQLYIAVSERQNLTVDKFYLATQDVIIKNDPRQSIRDYHLVNGSTLMFNVRIIPGQLGNSERLIDGEASGDKDAANFQVQWTEEPCCMTYDDDTDKKRAKLPCGCAIAPSAVKTYVEGKLEDGCYEFTCPGCETHLNFFLIYHVLSAVMSEEELRAATRQVDTNFLSKPEQDIRPCETCKYYCRRDFSQHWYGNRNRVNCLMCSQMEGRAVDFCWTCGQQWKDGLGGSCGNLACDKITQERLQRLATCEMKSIALYQEECPSLRACPRCGVLVEHTTGCKHVECLRCRCKFCFMCLKTQKADGKWQCGEEFHQCPVVSRQTTLLDPELQAEEFPRSTRTSQTLGSLHDLELISTLLNDEHYTVV